MVIWVLFFFNPLNLKKSCALTGVTEEAEDRLLSEGEVASNEEPLEDDLCDTNIKQAKYSAVKDDNSNEYKATTMDLTNPSTDN